jgi:CheY-like chemotaxis protein
MAPAADKAPSATAGLRVLVVEDETVIAMLVEDMLAELGHHVVAVAGTLEQAARLADEAEFDGALLDVNLHGLKVDPVADTLARRGIPFIFTTGYGERGVPESYRDRPALQKPYRTEDLGRALADAISNR